jgi:hypothetical protein
MSTRKAAAPAASVAALAVASPEITMVFDHAAIITELNGTTSAQERMLVLSKYTMGEVAAVGGRLASMVESVYETLNLKMVERHGADWTKIHRASPSELPDADKTRRKAINACLESIRETVKANSGGNNDKARDVLRRVKEWGDGTRTNKASKPKANAKDDIETWAAKWDNFPTMIRRIMNDDMDGVSPERSDALGAVADAMLYYFKLRNISERAVRDCSGKAEWPHSK